MNKNLKVIEYKGRTFSILAMPNTDIFRFEIICNKGASLERVYKKLHGKTVYGISHLIEHMSFKSTRDFSSKELLAQLKANGTYNASTWFDQIRYFYSTISEKWEFAVDSVTNETFNDLKNVTEEEFLKERSVVYNEVKRYNDNSQTMFNFNVNNQIRGHDSEDNVLGTPEIIETLTLGDCIAMKSLMLTEESHKYVLVYDPTKLSLETVLDKITNMIDGFPKNEFDENVDHLYWNMSGEYDHNHAFIPSDSDQSIVRAQMTLDKYSAFDVGYILNYISSMSEYSLNNSIREEHGLTYGISMYPSMLHHSLDLIFSCDVSKGNEDLTATLFKEAFDKILNGFTEEEYNAFMFKKRLSVSLSKLDQKRYLDYADIPFNDPMSYGEWKDVMSNNIEDADDKYQEKMTYDRMREIISYITDKVNNNEYKLIYGVKEE